MKRGVLTVTSQETTVLSKAAVNNNESDTAIELIALSCSWHFCLPISFLVLKGNRTSNTYNTCTCIECVHVHV